MCTVQYCTLFSLLFLTVHVSLPEERTLWWGTVEADELCLIARKLLAISCKNCEIFTKQLYEHVARFCKKHKGIACCVLCRRNMLYGNG